MPGKTVGELMEEMRIKAGAKEYHGHSYMDLQRFADDTRHMIIFDVLTNDSPVGWKGERTRLYLSQTGYEKALESQQKVRLKLSVMPMSEMAICIMSIRNRFVDAGILIMRR